MATTKRARKSTKKTEANAETPARNVEVVETTTVTVEPVDMQDAIRARAYELFAERGYEHGHDREDWLRAESEVLSRFGARTKR